MKTVTDSLEILDMMAKKYESEGDQFETAHYQLGSLSAILAIIFNENPELKEKYDFLLKAE